MKCNQARQTRSAFESRSVVKGEIFHRLGDDSGVRTAYPKADLGAPQNFDYLII